ncbi:MAG TPA: hypothetical protein VN914_14670, partial [Polyangia bacterium]|nr:hypothetical protein [Polyangia bacterium]
MARNVLALCALLVAGCRGGHGSALPPPSPGAPDGDAPGPAPDAAMPGAKEAGAPDLSTSEVPQPAAPDASADAAALAADTVWKACGSLAADITALAQSPDGKLLAIGYADGRVTLIEQAGMTVVGRFEINARLGIDKMTFTEDGGTLLTAGGGSVKVWTVPAGTFVRELGLTIGASSLQVTGGPMPLVLAAGGNVPPVTVWRLDGTRLGAMGDGPQAAFTDGGQAVVVIDNGSSPSRVTTLALDGTMLRRFPLPPFGGPRALSPDGTAVAVLFGDGTTEWVELYSTVNGKRLWRSTDGVKRTRQLAFLANPPRVVQLGDLGTRPLIHDATTGKTLAPLPFERAAEIDPAADGASVVAITGAGQLAKVSVADGAVRPGPASEFGVTQRIFGIAVSRDGRLLAAAGLSATWILDVREGALVKAMEVPGWKPDFSPDG